MDSQTYNVAYDVDRGEPRKSNSVGIKGDCVSCNRCVEVCPTGIDIRNGLQMECIGCTACVDACNEIMSKVNKPVDLISYQPAIPGKKVNLLRPRIAAYLLIFFVSMGSFAYGIKSHSRFSATFLKSAEAPYVISPEGKVINHVRVNLHNQAKSNLHFRISIDKKGAFSLTQATETLTIDAGDTKLVHLFVSFSKDQLNNEGTVNTKYLVENIDSGEIQIYESKLIGPQAKRLEEKL